MDREILFRGKRADNGEWIEGDLIHSLYKINDTCIGKFGCDLGFYQVIPETVGQYTGLTDKNGTKIFEGDIVRTKKYGKIVRHCNVNGYDTFKVVYAPAIFRIENKYRGFNLLGYGTDYEVIGNIHDNSDLLEVSE